MKWAPLQVDQLPEGGIHLPDRLLPFIWFFLRQGKKQFAVIIAASVIATSFLSLMPYFIKLFVDALDGIENKDTSFTPLIWVSLSFIAFPVILQSIFWRIGERTMARNNPRFNNMIRRQLSLYMNEHSYQYFQDDFAGRLSSKVVETASAISMSFRNFVQNFIWSGVTFIVSLVLYAQTGWYLLPVVFCLLGCYSVLLYKYLPTLKELSKIAADEQSILRGKHVDIVTNILTVKLFARKSHEDARFLQSLTSTAEKYVVLRLHYHEFSCWLDIIMKALWVFPTALALYIWSLGIISAGDVAMILSLSMHLGFTMWGFSFGLADFLEQLGQVQEGMETITKAHTVTDKKNAAKLHVSKADLVFDHMDFSYGSKSVFSDFTLNIPAGQKVGLVGPSGAGKSTLIQLLLRLFDVQGGAILIDGQNIADVTQDSLREHIAVIPQTTDLLHRSLRENIAYGRLNATEDEIIAAAKRAHAHEFILNMEDKDGRTGYDAIVGERGVKLSGGQRQRIAIARAILKDAPVLILDEATSALDSESEKLIQESLKDLMVGKTVIAIAHRLSTISHLDRLVVMEDGKIIEDGSHKELLKKNGLYAKLWSMQSGGFLGEDGA